MKAKRTKTHRPLSIATRLTGLTVLFILIAYTTLALVTMTNTSSAMTDSISTTLSVLDTANVSRINDAIDSVQGFDDTAQTVLGDFYADTSNAKATLKSSVNGDSLTQAQYDAENALTKLMVSYVENNENVYGVGVLLEPGAFNDGEYSLYLNKADLTDGTGIEVLPYSSYSEEDYYSPVRSSQTEGVTEPYQEDDTWMFTLYWPIIANGTFQGTVIVDINCDMFQVLDQSGSGYDVSFALFDEGETEMYDTNTDHVGQQLSAVMSSSDYAAVSSYLQGSSSFTVNTDSMMFSCAPVTVNGETWWVSVYGAKSVFMQSTYRILKLMVIGMAISAICLAFFVSLLIRHELKPLQELVKATNRLNEGHLDVDVKYNRDDEIGRVSKGLKTFADKSNLMISDITAQLGEIEKGDLDLDLESTEDAYIGDFAQLHEAMVGIRDNLTAIVMNVRVAADQVAVGSSQVAAGAQALAQGSTEQASSIEEVSSSMSNFSSRIRDTSDMTGKAASISHESNTAVQLSNQKMGEMSDSMQEITEKADEISKIIKTIDDIAFQTNILALNASIEAARAGSAGKGFAVVADEVGNLAKKSQEAAGSTAKLIEDTVAAVQKGATITDETAEALRKVSDSFSQISELVDSISKQSQAQADDIDEVTKHIDQISSVVQTNSATAEESAAAAEELSSQAEQMKKNMTTFRIRPQEENNQ